MGHRNYLSNVAKATSLANKLLLGHYQMTAEAEQRGDPAVWVDVSFPTTLLWAMDVIPIFPQVHGAFQAQRRKVKKMLAELEGKWDLPHYICGEVKAMIGILVYGDDAAFHLPKPSLLVSSNSSCSIVTKGMKYLGEHFGIDLLFADFPHVYDKVEPEMVAYTTQQLWEIIHGIEKKTGRKMDQDKWRKLSEDHYIVLKLWEQLCALNKASPAPVDALDMFLFSSCMTMLKVDEKMIALFVELFNEIYEKVLQNRKVANHDEKFRLLWHFLPISSQKKFFKDLFDQYGLSIVTATYFPLQESATDVWHYDFKYPVHDKQIAEAREAIHHSGILAGDLNLYVEDFAKSYLSMDVTQNIDYRKRIIHGLVSQYKVDGVLMHCDRSCRSQALPQYEIKNFLQEHKIPVLLFDADALDDRYFSASQLTTRFEAFIENLQNRG